MTGEEKRKLLKEQYKRDLQLRKEFLDKAKAMRPQARINKSLNEMMDAFNDDSDEWIAKLDGDTALTEAKFEMALDSAAEAERELETLAHEAELEKLNARKLVEQMKRDMGLLEDEPSIEIEIEGSEDEIKSEIEAAQADEPVKLPEPKPKPGKTMGDF
ncbi:MAG: hypothetical protein AB8F95_10255 [Bacteroidia bacterium]